MRTPKPVDTIHGQRWIVRYRKAGTQTSQRFDAHAEAAKFCIDLDEYGWREAERRFYDRLAETEATTPTLDEWVVTYLDTICDANPATRDKYLRNYNLHISRQLGTLPIGRITSEDARRVVRHMSEVTRLKDGTVANVFIVLSGAMSSAHKRGLISADPTAETKMPHRTSHLDGEAVFLTRAEYIALRAEFATFDADGNPRPANHFLPLIDFAVGTGARWGECAALTVRDIDYVARTVRINKAVKDDGTVGPPKTRRSNRTVAFPAEILATLLAATEGKKPNDLVFTMPRGGQLLHRTFSTRYLIPACITAGLTDPRPGFHSLRHSHASWLIEAGVDLVEVSRRLGHASIQTTVDTYGHLDPNATERQTQVAASVFAGELESV